jgi:hypothetical protein
MANPWRARAAVAAEPLALLLAIALRLRLAETYDPHWGYDVESHLGYLRYVAIHGALPPLHLLRTAYHPPLFYWVAALAARHGATLAGLRSIDLWAAIARLGLLAWGLRRLLPESALARTFALVLAGVLPAALQVDGMLSNEAPSILFCTAALILGALALRAQGRARWALSAGLAAALALALATKVSALALAALVAVFAIADGALAPGSLRARMGRALPLVLAAAVALAATLPIYARHRAESGRLIATGYDTVAPERALAEGVRDVPYLRRRPARYLVGLGSGAIFARPYYPSDASRFWPPLLASTFADYYGYRFAGTPLPGEAAVPVHDGAVAERTLVWARRSVAAGVPIALATLAALAAAAVALARRRDLARLFLVAAPVAAVAGQLHFAIAYPFDAEGPVKGAYLQFAAAPLFALFGVALAWTLRRRLRWPLFALELAALALVAGYSLHALHAGELGRRSAPEWTEPERGDVRTHEDR